MPLAISVFVFACVHINFQNMYVFAYVDSEGIGWSISFSDTGGGGYGCISGCVISSPSETRVHRSHNSLRRLQFGPAIDWSRICVSIRAREKSEGLLPTNPPRMTRWNGVSLQECDS